MPGRITFLCHGRTTARPSAFPADEPLRDDGAPERATIEASLGRIDRVLSSPARAARQTAEILERSYKVDPQLMDVDLGAWRGRLVADIQSEDPASLEAWLVGPDFAGHGGESRSVLQARVSTWLAGRMETEGHVLAVTHVAVIQAVVIDILRAPAAAFRHIDVEPLSALDIRSDGRRWTIRSLGKP